MTIWCKQLFYVVSDRMIVASHNSMIECDDVAKAILILPTPPFPHSKAQEREVIGWCAIDCVSYPLAVDLPILEEVTFSKLITQNG